MIVDVLLFAALRDRAGTDRLKVALEPGAKALDAVRACGLHPLAAGVRCAVNADFAPFDTPLNDGDELALLPPVSGG